MKRKDNESYENYRQRREEDKMFVKKWLNGRMSWNSHKLGTYRNEG